MTIRAAFYSLPLLSPLLSAATIVSWGPASDIKASGQNNLSENNGSRSIDFANFSSPSQGTDYYPNATGKTPDFYGASYSIRRSDSAPNAGGTIESSTWRVSHNNGGGNDFLLNNAPNGPSGDGGYDNEVHTAYFWTDAEFMTANDRTLTSMSLDNFDNGSGTTTQVRFLIQLGMTYYASEAFGESNSSIAFSDPGAVSWFSYDPTDDFSDFTGASASLSDFSNLAKAGYYVTASGGRFVSNSSTAFEVTAIPETSSAVLLGLAALTLGRRRRD